MNGFDNQGRTALHLAAERGHDKVLAILLAREDLDDVDPRDLLGQRTPLYLVYVISLHNKTHHKNNI